MASLALAISARVWDSRERGQVGVVPGVVDDQVTGVGDVPGHARVVGHVLPDHREGRGDLVLLQNLEDLRGVDRARPVVDGQRDRLRAVVHVVDRTGGGDGVGCGRGGMRFWLCGRCGVGRGLGCAGLGGVRRAVWARWPARGRRLVQGGGRQSLVGAADRAGDSEHQAAAGDEHHPARHGRLFRPPLIACFLAISAHSPGTAPLVSSISDAAGAPAVAIGCAAFLRRPSAG